MSVSEEVHVTPSGVATVTLYDGGTTLGVGHGFTITDARRQAQRRAAKRQAVETQAPGHCWSCGAPEDALGSCTGVCDPSDAADFVGEGW
jgi:hypothetical protein